MPLNDKIPEFQKALAQWFATAQRRLPWRTQPSLYRTVVSELMAQQTQIKTMLPYFERWMQRFPDFETLAEATSDDVLKHWEGLGYYSRARNLHKLAQTYVQLNPKPTTRAEWQALPGIGPYTSAAVTSIAFDQPEAVVDGNVVRILTRLNGDQQSFKSNGDAVKAITPIAERMLNHEEPGQHNQAMMELGATICLKHKPLCTLCPVVQFCQAAAQGTTDSIPKIERAATIKVEVQRLWLQYDHKLLLQQIPQDAKQLAGQYQLPEVQTLAIKPQEHQRIASKKRSITNKRYTEHIYQISPSAQLLKKIKDHPQLQWIAHQQLQQITLSGPHRKWITELQKL